MSANEADDRDAASARAAFGGRDGGIGRGAAYAFADRIKRGAASARAGAGGRAWSRRRGGCDAGAPTTVAADANEASAVKPSLSSNLEQQGAAAPACVGDACLCEEIHLAFVKAAIHNPHSKGERMNIPLVLICSVIAPAMAAELPFVGKWKVNLAKSDFGQTAVTFESLPGSEWQTTAFGVTYKFKMDGKDYPDGMGGTVAWKSVDANTWDVVAQANGKVTETDRYQLGTDGKTLTVAAKQMKPDGGAMESAIVYERVSGGPSLAGKWKTKNVSGASGTIEITTSGDNGIVFKDPDMGLSCDAKLDGKDYACTGPMLPPGFTVAMEHAARSLNLNGQERRQAFLQSHVYGRR